MGVRELKGVSDTLRHHTKQRCRAAGIPTKCVEDPNLAEITLRMTKAHLRIQGNQVPHKRSLEDPVPDSQVLQKLGAFLRGVGGMSALLDATDNGHGYIKKNIWVASLELLGFPVDPAHQAFKLLDKRSRGELVRTQVAEAFQKE